MSKYPADYLSHDAEYQRRRAAGYAGWEKASVLEAQLALLEEVFRAPYFPTGGRLLELGCGAGDLALWAARRGYEVEGVDISPAAIAWAREKAIQRGLAAQFQVGDVLDLSCYATGAFDILLDGHCFHCIVGMDRPRFLSEAFRVLKRGGVFHINTMCGEPGAPYQPQFDGESRNLLRNGAAIRHIGLPDSIEQEVTDAGFAILSKRILPRRSDAELDLLLLDVTKS